MYHIIYRMAGWIKETIEYLMRGEISVHIGNDSLNKSITVMLASYCPEVDTRWSYECGILNFARNSPRTLISVNQQQKSLRCLLKVTRLHSNTTRRFQEGITKATRRCDFKYDIYKKALRRFHDGYTASCYEHDAF